MPRGRLTSSKFNRRSDPPMSKFRPYSETRPTESFRPFSNPSLGSSMKLTGPSGRHTGRPRSRSPRRAHSPRRGRPPPFRSGLSNRNQGGPLRSPMRSTSRNSRLLSAKPSRSPPPRRHSLSPDGKRSPRKLSASRRKVTPPSSTKRRSLSPNSRRPSERGRSPRRLDSSSRSHRDARYLFLGSFFKMQPLAPGTSAAAASSSLSRPLLLPSAVVERGSTWAVAAA